jgi:hypothetical protein
MLYLNRPENPEDFKLVGGDLIPVLKEREKVRKIEDEKYMKKTHASL